MVIYLDNAATSWPKPKPVLDTLCTFLVDKGANPGRSSYRMATDAAAAMQHTRTRLARLVNAANPDRVIFTSNTTDALNLAIRGWLRPGDRAITTSMEHNSVRRPLRAAELAGVEVRRVPAGPTGVVDPARVREAAASGADLIAIVHASNVNGALQPIAEIAEIARAAGALLLVDAAQTAGAMPLDMAALGIDLLALPGHKGLFGPPGTGALVIGERVAIERLDPLRSGGTGVDSESDTQPLALPYRYEAGTVNTVGIAALGAGIEVVTTHGVAEIAAHHRELRARLAAGLAAIPGVRLYEPAQVDAAAVIALSIDGWQPADAGTVLDQHFGIACRTGLHCAPDACRTIGAPAEGTIRFSPGLTTSEEIDAAVAAVAEIAATPMR